MQNSHSITLEAPTTHGSQETLSFDKSGLSVQFSDAEFYIPVHSKMVKFNLV